MSRPQKHPNSGVYWLRKRVPDDLRLIVGKREEKLSLGTRNPEEAKRRHAQALIEIEARWASLRRGARTLTHQEFEQISALFCSAYLARWGTKEAENVQAALDFGAGERLWGKSNGADQFAEFPPTNWFSLMVDADCSAKSALDALSTNLADDYLRAQGLVVDSDSRSGVVEAVALALRWGSEIVISTNAFGYQSNPLAKQLLPHWALQVASARQQPFGIDRQLPGPAEQRPVGKQMPFDELFAGWVAEKQPREKTKYAWQSVLAQLGKFVGHTDASRVSADDLIRWKASLLEAKLRAKTIRDGKLAPVRALFQWGVDNRRLSQNPAQRVTIDLRSKLVDKKRGYTDDEARTVITAALKEKSVVLRWVPLLCAYTGARVSEVCQLRAEDVAEHDGISCVRFAPEAGALKNANSERAVPLHSALIDQGILKFVKEVGTGPLFEEIRPDRFGSRGGNGTKVLSRWVRSIGLTDLRLSPSHSWRHRLRTLGRRYGLANDILDAITGHQGKTVADKYGEFPVQALQRELEKIPVI